MVVIDRYTLDNDYHERYEIDVNDRLRVNIIDGYEIRDRQQGRFLRLFQRVFSPSWCLSLIWVR